jgi:acetylornithine deacetylase
MFNGHLDVVGTDGMVHPPFAAARARGRLYGRGSTDMKAGVASMCAAAWHAAQRGLAGEIVIAAVIDEEYESLGTRALIESGVRADAAIVTEPTRLAIMPAHRGFVWHQLTFTGRAAHGSRWELGVDAIRHAALVLAELDRLDREELPRRSHPLLGRPSLHASTITGGTGWSTYPDRCELRVERRTIPGETAAMVHGELEAACNAVRAANPSLQVDIALCTEQDSSDVPATAPIVLALADALAAHGLPAAIEGMSAWTDCALLNAAGIPAILFGPGDIALAHAAEEYVELDDITRATDVLTRLALDWCGTTAPAKARQ